VREDCRARFQGCVSVSTHQIAPPQFFDKAAISLHIDTARRTCLKRLAMLDGVGCGKKKYACRKQGVSLPPSNLESSATTNHVNLPLCPNHCSD
jgi:hypothetical protein